MFIILFHLRQIYAASFLSIVFAESLGTPLTILSVLTLLTLRTLHRKQSLDEVVADVLFSKYTKIKDKTFSVLKLKEAFL